MPGERGHADELAGRPELAPDVSSPSGTAAYRTRADPSTCGLAGWVNRFFGNRSRRHVVISNPAAVIEAAGSVAV